MDHPRNHEKKNNIKTLPLGVGGIVLFAGALVTATIVSALAFKTRSQRRSSPSNKLELTPEENHNYVHSGDSNEDIILPVVGEDQEITLICADSEGQNHLMLIDNENEEHVDANLSVFEEGVMWIQAHEEIEVPVKDIVSEASENEDEAATMEADYVNQVEFLEEFKADREVASDAQQMQVNQVCETSIDNHSTAKEDAPPSRLMNKEEKGEEIAQKVKEQVTLQDELFNEDEKEGVTSMQEHEAVEVPLKDIVSETSEDEDKDEEEEEEEGEDHQERVFMKNETATMEAEAEDNLHVQFLEDIVADHVCETFVGDQSTAKEDSPHSQLMNKEEKDELFNEDKKDQSTEAAMVDDQTHNPAKKLTNEEEKEDETDVQVKIEMLEEHVMVKKDEIPHVQSFKEDEIPHVQSVKEHEKVKKDEITHVQSFKEDEDSVEDVAVEDEISPYDLEDSSMNEELPPEAKISKHETLENEEKHKFASETWNLKLMIWSVLISVWCLCHWYFELPFLEFNLVGSLLFILILIGYRIRATYFVDRKIKHH